LRSTRVVTFGGRDGQLRDAGNGGGQEIENSDVRRIRRNQRGMRRERANSAARGVIEV